MDYMQDAAFIMNDICTFLIKSLVALLEIIGKLHTIVKMTAKLHFLTWGLRFLIRLSTSPHFFSPLIFLYFSA